MTKLCCNIHMYRGCICKRKWCRDCWDINHTDHTSTVDNIHRYYGSPFEDSAYQEWLFLGMNEDELLYKYPMDSYGVIRRRANGKEK